MHKSFSNITNIYHYNIALLEHVQIQTFLNATEDISFVKKKKKLEIQNHIFFIIYLISSSIFYFSYR